MKKLSGQTKIKTAVFISGTGSNLNNLIRFSLTKNSPIKICLVISNNSKAKGLDFAKKFKIKKKIFRFHKNEEKLVIRYLIKNKIEFICLAGFMKILSKNFINKFKGKIINIHPSLLPKYKGLNTHYRVIKNREKITGCTIHYVNSRLDSGKIILQKKVKVFKNDTLITLKKRVLKQEHIAYPLAIAKIFANL
tara:strand:- start:526 stop:1104 length:579 start_codon:yes stop_codon:yes gene_type:complete